MSSVSLPIHREVQALVHIRPDCEWFAPSLVPSHASAYVGSVSDHHAENGTTKCPESLCPMLALPPSGRRGPPPARTLLPGHRSYRLIRRSHSLSSPSALASFEESLQVATSPLLLAGPSRRYLCESFPECLGPCHGGPVECTCLFLPPRHRPSPVHYRGRLPALTRQNDFMTDPLFETAAISLCSGPPVCSIGIERECASRRWRVSILALSVCKVGSQFHHSHVSRGPPIIPDGRVSQVRFEVLACRQRAFPNRPELKR